jgi:hypothetical protein
MRTVDRQLHWRRYSGDRRTDAGAGERLLKESGREVVGAKEHEVWRLDQVRSEFLSTGFGAANTRSVSLTTVRRWRYVSMSFEWCRSLSAIRFRQVAVKRRTELALSP